MANGLGNAWRGGRDGRLRRTRNSLGVQAPRGFESHPLRCFQAP